MSFANLAAEPSKNKYHKKNSTFGRSYLVVPYFLCKFDQNLHLNT